MKKQYFLIILILFVSFLTNLNAQGDLWRTHFSYEGDVSAIERSADLVYGVSDGKLFSYSPTSQTYNVHVKKESNSDVKYISYNQATNSLLVIRDDFDMDILSGATFFNVPALKNTTLNLDKTIYNIFMNGDFAYLSTGFGVLVVDVKKKEVKQTCLFGYPVYSMTFYDNKLIASTSNGVMSISLDKNMQDDKNWDALTLSDKYNFSDYQFIDSEVRSLLVYQNKLHFIVPSRAVYVLNDGAVDRILAGLAPLSLVCNNNRLVAYKANMLWNFTDLKTFKQVTVGNLKFVMPDNVDNQYWTAIAAKQLSLLKTNNTAAETLSTNLRPAGPLMNNTFSMSYTGGKIRAVRGGYFLDRYFLAGQLSELTGDSWYNYPAPPIRARDYASVVANPLEPDNLFVPSWGDGIYEFKNKQYLKLYNQENSSLQEIFAPPVVGYIRVNGVAFDKNNRFWVANSLISKIIHVFEKSGSTWTSQPVYFPEIDNDKSLVNQILTDKDNNKWVIAMGPKPYIFIFNENGTISDPSDDKTKYVGTFYDQTGQTITEPHFYCAAEDRFGNIWIAASTGLYVIYKSDNIFNEDFVFNKVEVAKNDGTDFTGYFLENTSVRQMVIDKANRKWIATDAFGVYLLSANGQTVIHNFTTENSPLPSNRVLSVAIDDATGEVFFGTEKGIVSFSGAIVSDADRESSVYSFPNPVSSDYVGDITIRGCEINSLVKIVDEHNKVVSQGLASKGEYKWNMADLQGKLVSPGVYMAFGKDEDGKQGLLTQIRITN